MSLYTFLRKTKPPLAFSFTVWLPPTGSRRACTETVYSVERETGLEPATACLEGRLSHYRRSLDMNWPYSRFRRFVSYVNGPDKRCRARFFRLRQNMSRSDEGRISRAQSALEQVYQHFCDNTREAGVYSFITTRMVVDRRITWFSVTLTIWMTHERRDLSFLRIFFSLSNNIFRCIADV